MTGGIGAGRLAPSARRVARGAGVVVLAGLCATSFSRAAAPAPVIVEQWNSSEAADWRSTKVLAIGISDDRDLRHRFEDKLVSHLRAHGVAADTGYSLVPNLLAPGSREEILKIITDHQIDGAVTFRLVGLEKDGEAAWSAEWKKQVEAGGSLRALLEASLPLPVGKIKWCGVEVALWRGLPATRVWAGRTALHKLEDLRPQSGDLIQDVIDILQEKFRL